jgi:hypothetical protein
MPLQTTGSKRCIMCNEDRPVAQFSVQGGRWLLSYCKPCAADRQADWRRRNPGRAEAWRREDRRKHPEKYRQKERERYVNAVAVRLFSEARDGPCVDCGIRLPPQVMELDHVRGEKLFTMGGPKLRHRSEVEMRAEIEKCDVRCPNCHKLRHYHERQARKIPHG